MKPYLRILFATLWSGMAFCAAQAGAADLRPPLSALDSADQNSPETLNGRLAYAESLVEFADGTTDADCRQRVDAAQSQLDIVIAKPAFSVVLPRGAARAAGIAYRIHAARASCGAETSMQQSELRAARDAALRAVDLYRDGFDYPSMAVMQFDAAVADRQLGDQANASARLRTAVEMDREYGFQKDAEDNQALLQQWTGGESGSGHEGELTNAGPSRSAALKFAWSARDADVTVAASYATVVNDKIVRSQGAATRALSIRDDNPGWVMSFPSNIRTYNFDEWPKGPAASQELMTLILANIQLASPGIRVARTGDYKSVADPDKVSAKLSAETAKLIRYIVPESEGRAESMPSVSKAINYYAAPDEIEAMAEEDYALTTAAWIDAKLDQGVWYDMTSPMRGPGTATIIDHDVQFAYTRATPCTASATTSSCVEIVLHATLNPVALGKWADFIKSELKLPSAKAVHYWSETDMRIVTDPNNLLTYVSDVRRYWYFSVNGGGHGEPLIRSERIVSTSNYR